MRIDHVLLAVDDVERASAQLKAAHGLAAYEGGRHPGWGTANAIVPLGDAYLELVAVVDDTTARTSSFGRWVASQARATPTPFGWCVRPASLESTAERLGLDIDTGSRTTPSGEALSWRVAGLDQAAERPWLPFLIEWVDRASHPGRRGTMGDTSLRLEIEGDRDELADWLGEHALPVEVRPGRAGVVGVQLDGPSGPIALSRESG